MRTIIMHKAQLIMGLLVFLLSSQVSAEEKDSLVYVGMTTSAGYIELELNQTKAPVSVQNFLTYIESDFYTGTLFHRVVEGFVIQGGGYNEDMFKKTTLPPIKNEAHNGLPNNRGTIAMARRSETDSATSQFYINLSDNKMLNHYARLNDYGYAVFGRVTQGMDVVDQIASQEVNARSQPLQKVVIAEVKLLEQATTQQIPE